MRQSVTHIMEEFKRSWANNIIYTLAGIQQWGNGRSRVDHIQYRACESLFEVDLHVLW